MWCGPFVPRSSAVAPVFREQLKSFGASLPHSGPLRSGGARWGGEVGVYLVQSEEVGLCLLFALSFCLRSASDLPRAEEVPLFNGFKEQRLVPYNSVVLKPHVGLMGLKSGRW